MPEKSEAKEKNELSNKVFRKRKPQNVVVRKKKESKKLSNTEYEKKVIELANKKFTSEKIGGQLRQQGIHPKEYEKKISKILKEKNLYINPDLKNVEEKLKGIEKHSEKNKQDKRAMREKVRIYAKLKKLKEYFKVKTTL